MCASPEPRPGRKSNRRASAIGFTVEFAPREAGSTSEKLQTYAARFPTEAGGIALNCAGLAAWSGAVEQSQSVWASPSGTVRWIPLTGSMIILTLTLCKVCVAPEVVRKELNIPKLTGSYGSLAMAATLTAGELVTVNLTLARTAVYLAGSVQMLLVCYYYYLNWRLKAPPVPFWFPPTVGVGAFSIAGVRVSMPVELQVFVALLSAVQCAILWPWITWRMVKSPIGLMSDRQQSSPIVAPAPSAFVLAAPISLVGLAFFSVTNASRLREWDDILNDVRSSGRVRTHHPHNQCASCYAVSLSAWFRS